MVPEAAVCRNLDFVIFVYCDRKKDTKQQQKKPLWSLVSVKQRDIVRIFQIQVYWCCTVKINAVKLQF